MPEDKTFDVLCKMSTAKCSNCGYSFNLIEHIEQLDSLGLNECPHCKKKRKGGETR